MTGLTELRPARLHSDRIEQLHRGHLLTLAVIVRAAAQRIRDARETLVWGY